jgi:cytochrome c oxidase assembly protein subunit 15
MRSSSPSAPATLHLYRASWAIVAYTIIIIAWGAWVRISGSGDGCGDHWPLCHGAAVPLGGSVKTWTEVAHRYSTALFGVFVLAQLVAIRKLTLKGNAARFWILWTLLFTATEALIGRMLVKQGLVNESESLSRMYVMPLHLLNTSLLLFSEVMTAESVLFGARSRTHISQATRRWGVWLAVMMGILLGTGAVAALGSHLLPASSLSSGLSDDLSVTSHPAVRLRILHPILGLLLPVGVFLLYSVSSARASHATLRAMYGKFGLAVAVMVLIGVATLTLLAPTWLKLTHLTMANILVVLGSRCVFHTLRPPQSDTAPDHS